MLVTLMCEDKLYDVLFPEKIRGGIGSRITIWRLRT